MVFHSFLSIREKKRDLGSIVIRVNCSVYAAEARVTSEMQERSNQTPASDNQRNHP